MLRARGGTAAGTQPTSERRSRDHVSKTGCCRSDSLHPGLDHRMFHGTRRSKSSQEESAPQQRYEIIATAKAPGPWDKVKGFISYEVVNPQCTPEDKFVGVHAMPTDVGLEI